MIKATLPALLILASGTVLAEPETYQIDPRHTFPSFEADHNAGLSIWRGKINESSGTIMLDRAGQTGTVEVTMEMDSIDFGLEDMNEKARSAELFDVATYPTATYKGKLIEFKGDAPTAIEGELTMHGVTKPVRLTINSFLCKEHRMTKKLVCGADASGTLDRAEFGVNHGQQFGYFMETKLLISIEAVKQ